MCARRCRSRRCSSGRTRCPGRVADSVNDAEGLDAIPCRGGCRGSGYDRSRERLYLALVGIGVAEDRLGVGLARLVEEPDRARLAGKREGAPEPDVPEITVEV